MFLFYYKIEYYNNLKFKNAIISSRKIAGNKKWGTISIKIWK